jgi:hypothetical protein
MPDSVTQRMQLSPLEHKSAFASRGSSSQIELRWSNDWKATAGRHRPGYELRAWRHSPGFILTAIATLALGIAVNAAVFTVTNAVLFKGFSDIHRNDRILYMSSYEGCCVSYPDFLDWRAQAKSFERMAIVHGVEVVLGDKTGFPEYYYATEISSGALPLIGRTPNHRTRFRAIR